MLLFSRIQDCDVWEIWAVCCAARPIHNTRWFSGHPYVSCTTLCKMSWLSCNCFTAEGKKVCKTLLLCWILCWILDMTFSWCGRGATTFVCLCHCFAGPHILHDCCCTGAVEFVCLVQYHLRKLFLLLLYEVIFVYRTVKYLNCSHLNMQE